MNEAPPIDLREKLARIDAMLATHDRDRAQVEQLNADRDRKRQEIRHAPWLAFAAGATALAAVFAAGFGAGGVFIAALLK